jgi:hypothetical protein
MLWHRPDGALHVSSPVAIEPQAADLAHHPARWWLATRPAFLSITLAGVMLGMAGSGWTALRQHWPLAAGPDAGLAHPCCGQCHQ